MASAPTATPTPIPALASVAKPVSSKLLTPTLAPVGRVGLSVDIGAVVETVELEADDVVALSAAVKSTF